MIKYFYLTPIDGTLIGTTTLGQSEPESNGNQDAFVIFYSSQPTGLTVIC